MPPETPILLLEQLSKALSWKETLAVLTVRFLQEAQEECPVEHLFKDGHYFRTMRIPANTFFIGRPHRVGHEVQLLEGQVMLIHPKAREIRTAVDALQSFPGFQTVFVALTDVLGRTVHPDNGERDINKLENDIFESVDSIKALGQEVIQRLERESCPA